MKRRSFLALLGLAPMAAKAAEPTVREYRSTEVKATVTVTPDHPEFATYDRYAGYDALNFTPDKVRRAELAAKAAKVVTGHNDLVARMKATGRIV